MAEKSKIRSIRFTDELYELIDRQVGDTFTQKLENLVTRCVWELPAKEKQLEEIQLQMEKERKELRRIREEKQRAEYNFRELNYAMEQAKKNIERITKALSNIHP